MSVSLRNSEFTDIDTLKTRIKVRRRIGPVTLKETTTSWMQIKRNKVQVPTNNEDKYKN